MVFGFVYQHKSLMNGRNYMEKSNNTIRGYHDIPGFKIGKRKP